ncbi:hypothetical protein NSQ51_04800 [Geobacillus sp. FSL K6-0789]|uniref:Uncharacterized protein n=2 Tax=Geobacillus stearothermophilus TaxID=1422 RepID=A0A0K9HJ89_GEOSE|nr:MULTISPECIES: hypothetical protein [Geobacillus]KAF6511952.1 hypothetical protein GS8_251 [Geobacillus stearothermophilus]KMY58928.1 hypothetical protein AA906_09895 [Geobacillus stearothermophilus]KMY59515.1 hypothetical protein AA904_10730 [Geobacillus stearothermophilus]KMY65028.1 hypothetical protein AA905_00515 [Geobacillus stearothermophilus]KYD20808.1 hypothetical protein B4109_0820 [Geobacillus stearothermophilus]
MNHWDPHMNDPFLNASNQGDKAERMDNNAPPVAPLPTAPAAMPTAYYSPVTPYGYWCPPAVPMAPLVSPAHLDSPDEFDSPDSSDMMPPAPPLGLGAVPNVAPTFAWPVGGEENAPPLPDDGGVAPYDMAAPYEGVGAPVAGMTPGVVPSAMPIMGVTLGVAPSIAPGAVPYPPMYYPPAAPLPYAPAAPYGYPAAPLPPYYGGVAPYAPGLPAPYGPYR